MLFEGSRPTVTGASVGTGIGTDCPSARCHRKRGFEAVAMTCDSLAATLCDPRAAQRPAAAHTRLDRDFESPSRRRYDDGLAVAVPRVADAAEHSIGKLAILYDRQEVRPDQRLGLDANRALPWSRGSFDHERVGNEKLG